MSWFVVVIALTDFPNGLLGFCDKGTLFIQSYFDQGVKCYSKGGGQIFGEIVLVRTIYGLFLIF